jgi:hypothetical protein
MKCGESNGKTGLDQEMLILCLFLGKWYNKKIINNKKQNMQMKKIFAVTGAIALSLSMTSVAFAATDTDGVNLSVTVGETMTLNCGGDVDIDGGGANVVTPGTPVSNTTTCTVTTNDAEGYNLSVADDRGASNALYHETLSGTLDGQIADKTAWDPTLNAGDGNAVAWSSTGLGFGVLSSTATKNTTWWGTSTTCDDAGQLYAGLPSIDTNIMEHTAYSNASTDTVVCYRVDVPSTQIAGEYDGSVTYTATGRP